MLLARAILLIASSLLVFACSDDERDDDTEAHDEAPVPVAIDFDVRVHGQPFVCGNEYADVGSPPAPFRVTDARFYVHEVRLIGGSGNLSAVALDDSAFQGRGVVLLDFEDGCGPDGTPEMNKAITGMVPPGEYESIELTLGVPPEENFIDLAAAAPPLDVTGMFWTWQAGYKFLKIDGFSPLEEGGINPFFLHLGASGCPGDNPQAPPTGACNSPNRATYTLDGFRTNRTTVVAEIADLFAASDLRFNTDGTAPGCMSEAKDPECSILLPRVGIDDATKQHLFALE